MTNYNDTVGNRTRDLPVCGALPQPLRHRVHHILMYCMIIHGEYSVKVYSHVSLNDGGAF
jgi:hypothetical protein